MNAIVTIRAPFTKDCISRSLGHTTRYSMFINSLRGMVFLCTIIYSWYCLHSAKAWAVFATPNNRKLSCLGGVEVLRRPLYVSISKRVASFLTGKTDFVVISWQHLVPPPYNAVPVLLPPNLFSSFQVPDRLWCHLICTKSLENIQPCLVFENSLPCCLLPPWCKTPS